MSLFGQATANKSEFSRFLFSERSFEVANTLNSIECIFSPLERFIDSFMLYRVREGNESVFLCCLSVIH